MRKLMVVLVAILYFTCGESVSAANCERQNPNYYNKEMVAVVNFTDALIGEAQRYDDRISTEKLLDMVLRFQGICMNAQSIAKTDSRSKSKKTEIDLYTSACFRLSGELREDCRTGLNLPRNTRALAGFISLMKQFRNAVSSVA